MPITEVQTYSGKKTRQKKRGENNSFLRTKNH